MKNHKRIIAIVIAVALVICTGGILSTILEVSFAGNSVKVGNGKYIITNEKDMFAQFIGVSKNSATVTIPNTIKVKGKTYKVVSIAEGALKGNTKVKKLTIGKNVKTIGKKAFYGCKNLKTITINTTKLTNSSVKANAFKGLNSKAVVTVPANKLASYKKILKAKGLTGKKQTVKGKKMEEKEEEKTPEIIFDENHPLPDPEQAICSISNTSKVVETTKYSAKDGIPFSAKLQLPSEFYGVWGERKSYGIWVACGTCHTKFKDYDALALHSAMDNCHSFNDYFPEQKQEYKETYWIPDNDSCKVVFHVTLPEGLSYDENTIKLQHSVGIEIDDDAYHTEISGNELLITINDIKTEPFFSYNNDFLRVKSLQT